MSIDKKIILKISEERNPVMIDEQKEPLTEQSVADTKESASAEYALQTCKEALAKSQEQLRYLHADFENFRRNITRERAQWARAAQAPLLEDFLQILDDLERALAQMQSEEEKTRSASNTSFAQISFDGIELVYKNFINMMAKHGVTEISTEGTFNPLLHEAIIEIDAEGVPSGTVVQTLQKGYMYKDAVLRHAKVSVAK